MSRAQKRTGEQGQNIAEVALRMRGVLLVEKIASPVRIIRTMKLHGVTWHQIVWDEKVSGDHRGIMSNGTSVLAETKAIHERNLRWSDLRPHQPDRLNAHAAYAISLLVWVHSPDVFVMRWPIDGFGFRKSITVESAVRIDEETREWLRGL